MHSARFSRDRSAHIRRQARLDLARLRQERLAKRRTGDPADDMAFDTDPRVTIGMVQPTRNDQDHSSAPPIHPRGQDADDCDAPEFPPQSNPPAEFPSSEEPRSGSERSDRDEETTTDAVADATVGTNTPEGEGPTPPAASDAESAEGEFTSVRDFSGDASAEASTEVEPTPEIAAGSPGPLEADLPADRLETTSSNLYSLGGLGPGLVWMLGNCSIHSLADLSAADPEKLTQDLGIVGRILNVDALVARARELTEGDTSDAASRANAPI